ncbi:MAG: DNA polymerase III subunit delta' [Nitrospirae bacterium]|nr:DNA polymerase III subunit delta' [Nitrospirota bacterium]
MAFRDIIGQDRAIEILAGSIRNARISHAYLFSGDDGIGKRLTAINFAKAVNCLKAETRDKRQETSKYNNSSLVTRLSSLEKSLVTQIDSCDECPSCIKIKKGIHPDVLEISPEDGIIRVNEIRRLEELLSYKAFEGKWKVVIVDGAECLNQSAANAFLKTLEEPPGQSLIILVSSMLGLIPQTILSRCQRINFSPLPIKKLQDLLQQMGQGQASVLSRISQGRLGLALNGDLIQQRERSLNEFKTLINGPKDEIWGGGNRDAMEEWFDWALLWLRDIAVYKATGEATLLINYDMEAEIRELAENADLNTITALSKELYNIKGLLRFNLSKHITVYYTGILLKHSLKLNIKLGKVVD